MKSVVVAVWIAMISLPLEATPITDVPADNVTFPRAVAESTLPDVMAASALHLDPPEVEVSTVAADSRTVFEPSTLALLGLGVVGLLVARQRSSSKNSR